MAPGPTGAGRPPAVPVLAADDTGAPATDAPDALDVPSPGAEYDPGLLLGAASPTVSRALVPLGASTGVTSATRTEPMGPAPGVDPTVPVAVAVATGAGVGGLLVRRRVLTRTRRSVD